jgi:hypothetical protein
MCRFVPLASALLAIAASSAAASATGWEGEVLELHNRERAGWGVRPLAWDMGLAGSADTYASELARTDRWGHSPAELRRGQGENLWMGTTGAYPVRAMVGGWLSEKRWFRAGVFPAVSATGRWNDVGHYTQMVSSRSDRVGCAIRSNRKWTYLVCRYGPGGNVEGIRMP